MDINIKAKLRAYSNTSFPSIEDVLHNLIANEYRSDETYIIGDFVMKDNLLYKCIEEVRPPEEFDGNKWEQTNITNELINRK